MKAITIRQPWAWAVAIGAKTIENRTRGTSYRGPLAIHAGRTWSARGGGSQLVQAALADAGIRPPIEPDFHSRVFAYGAVIALAELVDSHPDTGCCRPWGESQYEEAGGRTRTVLHHLVLEDIRALTPPVPARGALGLWTVPDGLLEQLRATT